jgi:hypothetical protein
MNSCTVIKNLSHGQASFRIEENTRAGNSYENEVDIEILIQNSLPEKQTLTALSKNERHKIQKQITYYSKMENRTPKQEKKYQKALSEIKKTDGKMNNGKSEFVEIVFALTNTKNDTKSYKENLDKFALETKDKFEKLGIQTVTLVSHYDQNSPHFHLVAQIPPGATWSNLLKEHYEEDNSKKIYSIINNEMNKAYSLSSGAEMQTQEKGRFYNSLSKFKEVGNYENIRTDTKNKMRGLFTSMVEANILSKFKDGLTDAKRNLLRMYTHAHDNIYKHTTKRKRVLIRSRQSTIGEIQNSRRRDEQPNRNITLQSLQENRGTTYSRTRRANLRRGTSGTKSVELHRRAEELEHTVKVEKFIPPSRRNKDISRTRDFSR